MKESLLAEQLFMEMKAMRASVDHFHDDLGAISRQLEEVVLQSVCKMPDWFGGYLAS